MGPKGVMRSTMPFRRRRGLWPLLGVLASLCTATGAAIGMGAEGGIDVVVGVKLPVMIDGQNVEVEFSFDHDTEEGYSMDSAVLSMAASFCDQYIGSDMASCPDEVATELVLRASLLRNLSTVPLIEKVSRKLVSEGRGDMAVQVLEDTVGSLGRGGQQEHAVGLKELLGAAYYQSEALEAAKRVFEELVEAADRDQRVDELVVYLANLGVVLLDQGHFQQALQMLDRALELSGDRSEDALYHRGKILAYQGHHQAAIAAYQRLISLNPARGDGYRELGLSLIDLGRLGEAQELLQAALRQDANDLGALHRLQYATAAQRAEEARPDLHVDFVTFASDESHCGLRRLLRSAAHHGVSLRVLGLEAGGSWSNGSSKLRLLRDYLASRPAEQLVCALDGYDVILTGTPGQVLQRYRRFSSGGPSSPVVFSSDTVFFSRHSNASAYARDYPPSPTMYRFLNSGSLMGRAGDVLRLIDEGMERYGTEGWDGWCDQTIFLMMAVDQHHHRAPAGLPRVVVDVFQDLFGNTGGRAFANDFDVVGGRLHNRQTDAFPVVLHSPGLAHFQRVFTQLRDKGLQTDVLDCH